MTSDQATIHEIIQKLVKDQEEEYISAIFGMGEYRLAPAYKKHAVSPLEWSQKTVIQRKEYVKKVFKSQMELYFTDSVRNI